MNSLYNLVRVTTATTGTGPITLGPAVPGSLTFAQGGVPDGKQVSYGISDGLNSWMGEGVYTASGTTLTRITTFRSTGSGNNTDISLSGAAEVFITPAAEDLGMTKIHPLVTLTLTDPDNDRTATFGVTDGFSAVMDSPDGGYTLLKASGYTFVQVGGASGVTLIYGFLAFIDGSASSPALKRSSTSLQVRLADDSAYAPLEADTLRTATAYTVATLPAAGVAGRRAYVTNALTPAYGAAVVGGGAVVTPVFDTGAAWVVG